ncbi:HGxxPAAW family protein [Kocuria palustris]|uniref:HGxxPAAW family protein n=1 Tax=Kocuria palustris TaxID=71999 RepID=UPI0021B489BF|nr:HGxxPAAW family protein [Kocuria palustris]
MSHATPSPATSTSEAASAEADHEGLGSDVVVLDHTGYVGHGNTVAAWACIAVMTVGVVLALIGLTMSLGSVLMWIGIVVIVIGLIVGAVLKAMGMGYEGEVRKHASGSRTH